MNPISIYTLPAFPLYIIEKKHCIINMKEEKISFLYF